MKKNIISIIFTALLLISFSSCKKDFDPILYGTLSQLVFPSTQSDWELYVLQVYIPFNAKWGYPPPPTGYVGGYSLFQPDGSVFQYFDLSSDQSAYFPDWGGSFQYISQPNFGPDVNLPVWVTHFEKVRFVTNYTKIISDLDKANINDAAKRQQLKGEAHMARGTLMFYLLYMYGPVPVIIDPLMISTSAESDLTRPTRDVFVNSIANDLAIAADSLPATVPSSDYGRWTKGAALTFLMRLHLMEHNYTAAETDGRKIVALNQYSLTTDYQANFRGVNKQTSEIIWAISCDPNSQGRPGDGNMNALSWYMFPADFQGLNQAGGWGNPNAPYMANWNFYHSFEPGDKRQNTLVKSYPVRWDQTKTRDEFGTDGTSKLEGAVIWKNKDDINAAYQDNDVIVARYGDVLLMLAEAINQNSGPTVEAVGLVNQIRTRAGLPNLLAADIATKQTFTEALFRERTHEIFWEGLRHLDLVRFGKLTKATFDAAGKTNAILHELLPIPQYAIDGSNGKLIQNPGY